MVQRLADFAFRFNISSGFVKRTKQSKINLIIYEYDLLIAIWNDSELSRYSTTIKLHRILVTELISNYYITTI